MLCRSCKSAAKYRPFSSFPKTLHIFAALQLFRLVGGDEGVDEFVESAVHDAVDLVERQADAVVGDAALGKL